jgi:hypothetical protein
LNGLPCTAGERGVEGTCPPSAPSRITLPFAAILAAAVIACWIPGLGAVLCGDDFVLLEASRQTYARAGSPGAWLADVFLRTGFMDENYRPLPTHVYFLVMQGLFGLSPVAFHVAAILLHYLTSLAVGAIALRLGASRPAALLAAVFYATRDALFCTVLWASGIQDAMMTTLAAASTWAVIKGAGPTGRRRLWQSASVLFFAGSLLSKEMAVVLPAILSVVVWVSLADRRAWSTRLAESARTVWAHWALLAAYLVFRSTCLTFTIGTYPVGITGETPSRLPVYAVWTLIGWPSDAAGGQPGYAPVMVTGLILILAAVTAAIRAADHDRARARRLTGAGLIWWLIGVGFVMLQTGRCHMYYLSLPAVGAGLAAAGALDCVSGAATRRGHRVLLTGAMAVMVIVGGGMNYAKSEGLIQSGGFYYRDAVVRQKEMCDMLARLAPGMRGIRRVVFDDYVDMVTYRANPDGKGYRQVSNLDSMIRLTFNRPDLEVLYLVRPETPIGPVQLLPYNVAKADAYSAHDSRDSDLILKVVRR